MLQYSEKGNQVSCSSAAECLYTDAECAGVCQCPSATYENADTRTCVPSKFCASVCVTHELGQRRFHRPVSVFIIELI